MYMVANGPRPGQGADDAHVVAPVARGAATGTRAAEAARIKSGHRPVAAALVEENQIARVNALDDLRRVGGAQGLHPLALPLVGKEGLLFLA